MSESITNDSPNLPTSHHATATPPTGTALRPDETTARRIAGFRHRLVALVIDVVILVAATLSLVHSSSWVRVPYLESVAWFCSIVLPLAYYVTSHARFGRTLGKRAVRLRVVTCAGEKIGWTRSILRESPWIIAAAVECWLLAKAGSAWPAGFSNSDHQGTWATLLLARLGFTLFSALTVFGTRRHRAIHDYLGGTIVVFD